LGGWVGGWVCWWVVVRSLLYRLILGRKMTAAICRRTNTTASRLMPFFREVLHRGRCRWGGARKWRCKMELVQLKEEVEVTCRRGRRLAP